MVTKEEIMEVIKGHLNRVLLIVESSLSESQFRACRRLILDELGQGGLGRELDMLLGKREKERQGRE